MQQTLESICILRLSAIGDVCHAVAVVQAIQRAYPSASITWVIGKVEAMLLKGLPGVRFVVFDKRGGLGAYKQLKKDLPETFDVLLHMQVALRANLAAGCIKAKRKIGFPKVISKELHGLFVSERAPLAHKPHVLDGFAAFAEAIGVTISRPEWHIPISLQDRSFASSQLKLIGDKVGPVLLVSPSASKAERNWLPERYAAVMEHAHTQGFVLMLCGGPTVSEAELASAILQHCKAPVLNLVGKTTLKQLLALISEAAIVLSPDSGPAHMATTQGVPVIGLYAHSNPARTGPYFSLETTIDAYSQHIRQQTGKPANQLPWGTRAKGEDLMTAITVKQVIECFNALARKQGFIS